MNKFKLGIVVLLILVFSASPSKAQDRVEIFGGYSFVRPPVTFFESNDACVVGGCPAVFSQRLNLSGLEVSGAYRVFGPLQLAGDFSGNFGSFHGASTHLQTYLFGPQIHFPGPVSPFAHVLIGGAHESIGTSNLSEGFIGGPSQNAFATAVGVGIDLKVAPFISVRPIQFDYLVTRFNSGTQNQPRVSAGVVLHF